MSCFLKYSGILFNMFAPLKLSPTKLLPKLYNEELMSGNKAYRCPKN